MVDFQPRSTVLLDTGTPGTSGEIYNEDDYSFIICKVALLWTCNC